MAVALGPNLSAEVFKHLSQDEIDELVLEIAVARQGRRRRSASW